MRIHIFCEIISPQLRRMRLREVVSGCDAGYKLTVRKNLSETAPWYKKKGGKNNLPPAVVALSA